MKRLLLISLGALCLGGCVHPSPYGYSRYTTVTPVYPQTHYDEHRYYAPSPPRYRYSERGEEHHHHRNFQQRRHW